MKEITFLLRLLRPFVGSILLSIILGAAAIASGIGLMGTSAYLIAFAALHPSISALQIAIVGVRFFGINRGVMRYLERLVSHNVTFRLLASLRNWFYRQVEPLAPAGLIQYKSGDLLARSIADIDLLENFYVRVVAPPLTAVIILLGAGWFTGSLHPSLGWGLIIGLLLSGVGVPTIAFLLGRQPGKDMVAARSELYALLTETYQGWMDLLSFQQENKMSKKIAKVQSELSKAQTQLAHVNALSFATNLLIANLSMVGILVFAISLVSAGKMDGVLLTVVTLITLASFESVQPLSLAGQHLSACLSAVQRLKDITSQNPAAIEPASPRACAGEPSVELKEVSFRYNKDERTVLDRVSFSLRPGEHTALLGDNGSGKSTLAYLLLRFWDFESGSIRLCDVDIRDLSSSTVRQSIGAILQPVHLFHSTLRSNLLLAAPESTDEQLMDVLHRCGLGDWYRKLSSGLDTLLGEMDAPLSEGERQRIAVARLILQDAPIWILDEPTANLDNDTAAKLMTLVLSSAKDKCLLWITHQIYGLDQMHQLIFLQNGRITEQGQPQDLLTRRGYYWNICQLLRP